MKIADLFAGLRLKPDKASFDAGDKLITGVKVGLGAIAAFAGFRWAQGLIAQTVELGGKLSDLSQQVGIPAETLQELGYAGEQSSVSMQSLANSLGKLAKLAYDAKKGGKEAGDAFRKVGVSVRGADGSLKSADVLLAEIANHISKLPDGTEKTAKAMALFGRSGKEMIPLLNEGGDGIAALRKEFVELGGVIDGDTVDALEAFGDEQDKIKVAFDGIRNQAVVAILPTLRALVKTFLEWVKANRVLIRQSLARVMQGVALVLKGLFKILSTGMKVLDQLIKHWRLVVTTLATTATAVLYLRGAFTALSITSIKAALATAAAWAAALAPFVAIAAIIALIALLAEDIWVWAEGGDSLVGDIHESLVKALVDAFEVFFTWFDDKVTAMARKIRRVLPEWLGGASLDEQIRWDNPNFQGRLGDNTQTDPRLEGVDFFSPEYTVIANQIAEEQDRTKGGRRDVANVAINAPITINGTAAQDPNEIARLVQVKLEGILRTAQAATTE